MITEDRIQQIKQKIVDTVAPEKIILFGSYATGAATEDSDLDLVIVWDAAMSRPERNLTIRRLFPMRDFSLDVFVFTQEEENKYKKIKGTIAYVAFSKGKILYERR